MPTRIVQKTSNNVTPNPQENGDGPKFQFRGIHLPPEIILLLTEKKINRTDMLVLLLVEALVTPRGKGCWASNKYISRSIGIHHINVAKSISKLAGKKFNLIVITYENGQRYLETAWSRTGNEVANPLSENANPPLSENANPLPYNREELEGGVSAATPPHTSPPFQPSANGKTSKGRKNSAPSPAELIEDQATDDARSFREALRSHGIHVDDTVKGCSAELRRLFRQHPEAREVFLWFKENCGRDRVKELGLPAISSGRQFCKRYEWIRGKWEQIKETKSSRKDGKMFTFTIKRRVQTKLPNGNISDRVVKETVTRFRKYRQAVNEHGREYREWEHLENLLNEGEHLAEDGH